MTAELAYLGAVEALGLFRRQELSPVELMRAVVERAERTEPVINAFAERCFDEALQRAAAAERRYLGRGDEPPRPLEGLPIATKELHAIAGRTLSTGSLVTRDLVATENAPIVDRVLDAGGIVHARTTEPEFGITAYTHGRLWGVTRNPWNPQYSPGGSSGGAAASLAAGSTTLATASDIGGSIRIPAGFTGTVGFRPPHGRVPAAAPVCADSFRSDGPMARSVDDCILFTNALSGPDPRDHDSLRPRLELPAAYPSVDGMRIALCAHLGDYPLHPDVERNVRATAAALGEAGATVVEITLPWTRERVVQAVAPHFASIFGANVVAVVHEHPDLVCDYTRDFAEQMQTAARTWSFLDGVRMQTALQRELGEAMAGYDALLCPTTAVPGFPAGDAMLDGCVVDGHDYGPVTEQLMTLPFNINGNCPVLNVPSGRTSSGLPIGVQIVGHTFDDATVFRVGKAVEQACPWDYGHTRPQLAPAG